jgi:diguanylate cyclase (GGDEF)-like protein/PAS domain S-box-containing protein
MPMGLTLPSQSPLRWVQAVMGEGAAHRRVRVAMYSMLVLLASLAIMRAFRIGQSEQVRQMDMEIIRVAGAQSALTQRMGLQAAQFVLHPANTREEADYLADTLRLSQLQAQQLEDLLAKLTPLAPQTPEAVTQALRGWQDSREALWYRVQAVLWQVQQHDSVAMTHAIGQLQNELDTSQLSSAALVEAIQDAARGRSERTVTQIRMLTVGAIVLFVLMGFFIIEPTARAVRRQYRALARQTERLQRLAMVAELSSNAIAITDSKNRVEWVNQAFTALTDYTQKQARGRRIGTLLKARSVEPARFAEFAMALRKGVGIQREIRITARRSELGWVRVDMQPIHDSGGALNGWVLVATDLTEVREQQQLLELAVDGAGLGIWHWDMVGGTMDCNVRMLTILGYAAGEMDMSAAAWMDMIHPDDQGAWTDSLRRHLRDRTQAHRQAVRLRHRSGRWVWVLFAGNVADSNPQGRALRLAGVAMDVNAQKAMEQQLRTAARTDGLTSLPNRTVVVEMIRAAIARRQAQPGYNFAVLFMDFDRFKQVNDTLGHSVGDELLRQIARRLQDSLRPGDSFVHTSDFEQMAARIGGDEFVVLLDDIRGDLDAEIVAGRLLDVLAVPYQVSTHRVSSTVSIGIVTSTHAEQDADSVLRDADIAMYEAKRSGRARYAMFDPGMRMRVSASVSLENDLRQALANGEMYVVYQPVLHLPAAKLAGVEALVRWRHPQRGLVPPVDFIPLAEACGLIDALGQYVLREACHAFDAMQQQLGALAPPTMAVNLSRAQLRQPGLVSDIVDAVRASNMSPHQLVLEVTESLAAQDAEVQSTLREIRALGVGLSLDDFGTGYSSLSCLHELPVNTVKIDRSFVSQASQSEYHRVLIEATLRVARTLGLDTVAEGIETPEQASLMASMGCKKGQGFLFSKPLEQADLIAWAQRVPPSPSS